jgi:hypothetical protein
MRDLELAGSEAEGFELLARTMQQADFDYFEVMPADDKSHHYHRWSAPARGEDRGLVSAEFPVGRDDNARAWIKFGWRPESEDVSPQSDILLRLAVDAIERRFVAFGSSLRPANAATDVVSTTQPAAEKVEAAADVAIHLTHEAR